VRHHVLDRRQLITLAQHAEAQRLAHLPHQLLIRRQTGPGIQVKLDHRPIH
jgi:hypothetical protein